MEGSIGVAANSTNTTPVDIGLIWQHVEATHNVRHVILLAGKRAKCCNCINLDAKKRASHSIYTCNGVTIWIHLVVEKHFTDHQNKSGDLSLLQLCLQPHLGETTGIVFGIDVWYSVVYFSLQSYPYGYSIDFFIK